MSDEQFEGAHPQYLLDGEDGNGVAKAPEPHVPRIKLIL